MDYQYPPCKHLYMVIALVLVGLIGGAFAAMGDLPALLWAAGISLWLLGLAAVAIDIRREASRDGLTRETVVGLRLRAALRYLNLFLP